MGKTYQVDTNLYNILNLNKKNYWGGVQWQVVFLFKGIVPSRHFSTIVESGAPRKPNHNARM